MRLWRPAMIAVELFVVMGFASTFALASLKSPGADPLPPGFVPFHDPAEWPIVAKRAFRADDGKWTRGNEYIQISVGPATMSLDRERIIRVRDSDNHGFPVASVIATKICRASIPAFLIEARPPARTFRTVIAHIGGLAYSIGYWSVSPRVSTDVVTFIDAFCGYSPRELRLVNQR